MSKERGTSFPPGEIGKLHTEHGRTWRYVEPGMWKSVNTSGGGGGGSWDEITDKPTEFPPEAHTHDQYALSDDVDTDVDRIETEMLNLSGEITAEAATRKSNDDALGLRIDAIEDSVSDGGGFVDAPDDGKLYGRQSEAWAEVVIPDAGASSWDDLTDKPTEFPPESHSHVVADITDFDPADYQPKGDYATTTYVDDSIAAIDIPEVDLTGYATETYVDESIAAIPEADLTGYATETYVDDAVAAIDIPDEYDDTGIKADLATETQARIDGDSSLQQQITDLAGGGISTNLEGVWAYNDSTAVAGSFTSRNADWATATTITVHKEDGSGFEHNFALMNEGDVIFIQAPAGGAEYTVVEKTPAADTCSFTVNTVSYYGTFPTAGDESQINFIPQVSLIGSGDNAGQVTTWSGASWTPSNALVITGDDASFAGTVTANTLVGDGSGITGVLKSFTETDPTVPSHVKSITQTNIDNWNAAASSSGGGGLPDGGYTYGWSITASDFIATSDRRVKKNIVTAPTGVLEKIRGVEFEWRESGQLSSGVIAQELEAVPELAHLVHTGEEEGTKHVSYLGLIGYLIEEVKSLRAEIEEIK